MPAGDAGSSMKESVNRYPFGKEEVAKLIEDTYRKMYAGEAIDIESNGQNGSHSNSRMLQVQHDIFQSRAKICCPCESLLVTESMIRCEDPQCHVLQHTGCVIILDKPLEAFPPIPQFYCGACRIKRADPFWVTVAHPLYPLKMTTANTPVNGENPVQYVEKLFHLTRAERDLILKTEFDVQVWCILLNDKVPFRMHWPQYANLQVNGIAVRTIIDRSGSQPLGANGRDDGPLIKACISDGVNKISLRGRDSRIFCFGVRIVKRRTVQQILDLILKQLDVEKLEDALARIRRCLGGGATIESADSDSDLEVVADSVTVNLRCPMSGSRIKIAGRFKPCAHIGCFDLETFVELNQRTRKWQCPICLKNYSLENIIIDPYFNRITTMMLCCEEDLTDIEVKSDGSWHAKSGECWDLAQWHFPDGTLCVTTDKVNIKLENSNQVKQERLPEGRTGLRLETNENYHGFRDINKPGGTCTFSSANVMQKKFDNHSKNFIPMSSSANSSGRDGEDSSVNQEGHGHSEMAANMGNEYDTVSPKFDPTFGVAKNPSSISGNADIIVLSDSDEDNEDLICPGTIFEFDQAHVSSTSYNNSHTGVAADSWPEDPGFSTNCSNRLKHSGNGSNFGRPHCGFPSIALTGSGLPVFGSEVNVSDVNVQHSSIAYHLPMNGYSCLPYKAMGSPTQISDSSCCSNANINDSLFDTALPFCGDFPSLQDFPPTSGTSEHFYLKDQSGISNVAHTDDWLSSLGGSGCSGVGLGDYAAENGLNSTNWFASGDVGMESSDSTGSSILSHLPLRPQSVRPCFNRMTINKDDSQGASILSNQPLPPESVRPCFNRMTTNKDGDDRAKRMLPLSTAPLLPRLHDGVSNRTMFSQENVDLSLYCHRLSTTDQERDPGPAAGLHGASTMAP